MTTIAAFATISPQNKKIYLLSDSRVTWPVEGLPKFDNSTKLFPLKNGPDVFAYCGDSLFSLSVLSRIKTQLDSYYKYKISTDVSWKMGVVKSFLNESLKHYPKNHLNQNIIITHYFAADGEFYGFMYSYDHKTKKAFEVSTIEIPSKTGFIIASGSGAASFKYQLDKQIKVFGEQAYSIFYTFFEFIRSEKDPRTGGPPQIIQLDSNGKIKLIGIHVEGEINVLGESNEFWKNEYSIEIRSKYFELSDNDGNRLSKEKDRSYQNYLD